MDELYNYFIIWVTGYLTTLFLLGLRQKRDQCGEEMGALILAMIWPAYILVLPVAISLGIYHLGGKIGRMF